MVGKAGQSSLEAMVAFTAFLLVVAMLAAAAGRMGKQAAETARLSSEIYLLSYEVFCLDTAASSLHSSELHIGLRGIPSQDRKAIQSKEVPYASQFLFHRATISPEGKVTIEEDEYEPV